MKLFKHKHKWHLQNHLEKHVFSNGKEEEAVILTCDCDNCEMAGKNIANRVSHLQGAFTEGRDSIIRFLEQYDSAENLARNLTYENPEWWTVYAK